MNFLLAAAFQMMYKFTHLRMFFQKGSARKYWDMQTKPRTKEKKERKNQGHANARDAKGLDMIAAIVQLRRAETAYTFLLVFKHLAFVFQNFQTAYN